MAFLRWLLRLGVLGALGATWLLAGVYLYLSPNLPDVETLRDVRLQTPMRVYSLDGELIGQFGEQKRNPLRFEEIPEQFVQALLAAEDDGFFRHNGIDFAGLLRAVSELVLTGEKGSGGSTLTMQVARNYFLTLERTFMRKFNEILLAIEIERRLSKEEIFELYVNRVFLGHRAYGFEAAAQVYYGRGMGELTLAQHAMLAGIPKAPSRNNPLTDPEAGQARRNWILGRMRSLGFIGDDAYAAASGAPVTAEQHGARISLQAPHAAEMARRQMIQRYGVSAYTEGYNVYTTIDSRLQRVAEQAVVQGLLTYDERHGYRGPEQQLPPEGVDDPTIRERWLAALDATEEVAGMAPAIVSAVDENGVDLLLTAGEPARLPFENGLDEARAYRSENARGAPPERPSDVLAVGDLIRVRRQNDQSWELAQLPAAQAALVSINPDNGAIFSLVGGLGFELSKFNRATQAQRQPGSNLKPFLYAAALDSGFTAASIINDAPIVLEDASLEGVWRPENDGGRFYGPTRLRWALTRSRNLVSIRILQELGVRRFIEYATKLGFDTENFAPDLSLALGTHAMAPLDVATAYAVLANGGYRVEPYLIERIEDLDGEVLVTAEPATVPKTEQAQPAESSELSMEEILSGSEANEAPRVMDERVNFIIDDILQDVIKRGTGRRALVLERADIAGKTGTTNGPVDAWFSGYNPNVVTTAWVGFDNYTPLGRREFGGTAALPIWIEFMREALKGRPEVPRTLPAGISRVRIDPDSGLLAPAGQSDAIFEYFRLENVPEADDGSGANGQQGTDDLIQEIF